MTRLISMLLTALFTLVAGMANTAHAIPGKVTTNGAPLLEEQLHLNMNDLANTPIIASETVRSTNAATQNSLSKKSTPKFEQTYGNLPIHFEPNMGQTDSEVKFTARGAGYTLFLTETEAVFSLAAPLKAKVDTAISNHPARFDQLVQIKKDNKTALPEVLRMKPGGKNLNKSPKVTGLEKQTGVSNYFLGNNKTEWKTNVPHFSKVEYEDVYPGIDLVYYGNPQQLEYDFVVEPGADPNQIQLAFTGADNISIDKNGNLNITVNDLELTFKAPVIYQIKNNKKQLIAGNYVIKNNQVNFANQLIEAPTHQIGFKLATYDTSLPIIIDPVLIYSSYLGWDSYTYSRSIVVDDNQNIYLTGYTSSDNFPVLNAAFDEKSGTFDAFIMRLDTNKKIVYSTYLGGSYSNYPAGGGYNFGNDISLDTDGNAYLTGSTDTSDFPTLNAAFATPSEFHDAFATCLDRTGQLVFSTYLGGNGYDSGHGITTNPAGDSFITGITTSTNFPVLYAVDDSFSGATDAFITQLNKNGQLVFSTYLGGHSHDRGTDITIDENTNVYVTGESESTDFPVVNATYGSNSGNSDAFITSLNSSGQFNYSTYLGGNNNDYGTGITVDTIGNVYVIGSTASSNFPILSGYDDTLEDSDAFVTKLDSTGQAVYSTFIGGSGTETGESIETDFNGNVYITGYTNSEDYPTVNAFQNQLSGASDIFITLLGSNKQLIFSSYLGGNYSEFVESSDIDSKGNLYITGMTYSTDFPTINATNDNLTGSNDSFITILSPADVFYEDLSIWPWEQSNAIEVIGLGNDSYQLTHPGSNWPILSKDLPTIPPGAQLKISFTGSSSHDGALLQINPWTLSETGGGHVYLTGTETAYEKIYTNETGTDITDAQLRFFFADSLSSGAGQTIDVSNLQYEIILAPNEPEYLTTWEQLNGIEVIKLSTYSYQLIHPGFNWPILRKELPTIPPGSKLKVSFTGSSSPAGALLQISPWYLAMTGGGHIYLTETEASYERVYTNESANDITDAQLRFFFEDSLSSGAGQTLNISDLRFEISGATSEIKLTPTDDANNRAILDGQLAVSKWEHAFLRFDLTDIQDSVTRATLRVYDTGARVPHTLSVSAVDDDNWSEDTSTPAITLHPLNPDALLDSVEVQGTGYVEQDVTSFVASQAAGDGIATLELSTVLSNWILVNSKEGTYPPELLIETGSKSWSEPEVIGTGYSPEVFYDETNGNAVAVWDDLDNKVWARRYIPETGWAQPEYIGDGVFRQYFRDATKAVISQSGNITVAWSSSTDNTLSIMVNQYSPVTGWSDPEIIQQHESDGYDVLIPVSIDTDSTGKIMIITETDVSQNYSFIINAVEYIPASGWSSPEELYNYLDDTGSAINLEQVKFRYYSSGDGILTWAKRRSQTSSYTIEFRSLSYDKQSGWDDNIILVFRRYQDTGTQDPIRYRTAADSDENIILVIMIEEYNYGTNEVSANISYKKHIRDAGWGETFPVTNYDSNVNIFQLANNKAGDIILVSNNESRRYHTVSAWSVPEPFTEPDPANNSYFRNQKITLDSTGQHGMLVWSEENMISYAVMNPGTGWSDLENIPIDRFSNVFDLAINENGYAVMLWGDIFSSSDINASVFQ